MGVGALCFALGLLLTLTDDSGDDASPSVDQITTTTTTAPPSPSTTSGAPPVPASTTTVTPQTTAFTAPEDASVEARSFFANWQQANRAGDIDLLLALLHPLVIERYGAEQCRGYLPTVTDEQVIIEVREATLDPNRRYETDGQTATPADAYAVQITRADRGADAVELTATLAFVDGELRWFTDCGDPV